MDKKIIENGFYILRFINDDENILEFKEAVSHEFLQKKDYGIFL